MSSVVSKSKKFRNLATSIAIAIGLTTAPFVALEPAESAMVCPAGWTKSSGMMGTGYCDFAVSAGEASFTVPSGITSVSAWVVGGGGGGGGGGGADVAGPNMLAGGGGGGGEFLQGTISVSGGETILLHAGTAGAGGAGGLSATDGSPGTSSYITVDGGSQQLVADPGQGGKSGINGGNGGAAGDGSPGGLGITSGGYSAGGGGGGGDGYPGVDATLAKGGDGGDHSRPAGLYGFPSLGVGWAATISGVGVTLVGGGGGGAIFASTGCASGLTAPHLGSGGTSGSHGFGGGYTIRWDGNVSYCATPTTGSGGGKAGIGGSAGVGPLGGTVGGNGIVWLRIVQQDLPANLITYTYNGATGGNSIANEYFIIGGNGVTLPAPTKPGYVFDGWYTEAGFTNRVTSPYSPGADITLHAKWAVGTYTVTYEYNGATSGNETVSDSYTTGGTAITLPVPARLGYTFGGWYKNVGLTTSASSPFTTTADQTLYAKWIAETYTITYEYNGATAGNTTVSDSYTSGNAGVTLPEPTKDNFAFAGWFTDSSFSNQVSSPFTTVENVTLYAKWASLASKVTFVYNGATSGNNTSYAIYSEGEGGIDLPRPKKTGYDFAGWYLDAELTDRVASPFTTDAPVTLYAKWTPSTYKIKFEYNLATEGDDLRNTSYTTGSEALILPEPKRPGYDFAGWYTEYNFINKASSPFVPTVGGVLFAKWVRNAGALLKVNVYFLGDSAALTAKGKSTLLTAIRKAKSKDEVQVTVNGFVKQTAGSSTKADYRLSLKRARVIVAFLKANGLKATYVAVAKGVAKEKTAKARRAEVSLTW